MTTFSESSKSPQLRLAIMILAAGEGSRLGGYPKALLMKDGRSLLNRFSHSVQSLNPTEILLVSGFYSDAIEAEANILNQEIQSPITWVRNPNPEAGQASSVRLGLESLKSHYDVLLVALCDQPHIQAVEIESLLEQFHQRTADQEIILPIVNGQRGNPVLFSKKVIQQVLAIPDMVCRAYMDQHPEMVRAFVTQNQAYLQDVDTPADIRKLDIDDPKPI